jgi:hypothetical protein
LPNRLSGISCRCPIEGVLLFEFSESYAIYQALEAEEELGDGSGEEDAASDV